MTNRLRIDGPGLWHHVFNRGARREPIFRDDVDCGAFLGFVGDAVDHYGLELHAYSLMPNHYHLLFQSRFGRLSDGMRHIGSMYTLSLNSRHAWDGPVFRGRFKNQIIRDERHLKHLFAYIHLNPFKAGLVTQVEAPCWTSLRAYLGKERTPRWLSTWMFEQVLGGPSGARRIVLERRKHPEDFPENMDVDEGWFREEQESTKRRSQRSTPVARVVPPSLESTLRLVCQIACCDPATLHQAEKGRGANPARRFATWALRQEGLPQRQIAQALEMKPSHVGRMVHALKTPPAAEPIRSWMSEFKISREVASTAVTSSEPSAGPPARKCNV